MRVFILALFLVLAVPGNAPAEDNLAGIYVQCPRKNETLCNQARDDFRMVFPNGQPHPYFMIKSGDSGYLAPDEKMTTGFTITRREPGLMVFKMRDRAKSKMELKKTDTYWRDQKNDHIYIKAIEDEEWNIPPRPFKEKMKNEQ